MADKITLEEWLDELQTASNQSDDGMTVAEMVSVTGRSTRHIHKALTAAKVGGRLVVGRRACESLDGKAIRVPCYRIKPANRKK